MNGMNKSGIDFRKARREELESIVARARTAALSEQDCQQLRAAVETLAWLTQLLQDKKTTIERLRRILFGPSSEKMSRVLKSAKPEGRGGIAAKKERIGVNRTPGHGRNGAYDYAGASKIKVKHDRLKHGQRCPQCQKGKVYDVATPGVLVCVVGQAPVAAKVYELEKLRCNLCGEVFTADAPAEAGPEKYDKSAASMIAMLKYGSGFPFHRLERLQENLGIPLPASTQWEIVAETAEVLAPVYEELIHQSAQGEVLHNDNTTMTILELGRDGPKEKEEDEDESQESEKWKQRKGVFTSGIVSTRAGQKIALFFTGRKHAGENLAAVLARRAVDLGPPIQMCDALARNLPKPLQVILANCIAHGRRRFVEVAHVFPEECRYVLEALAEVYKNDALCWERGTSPEERLRFHQTYSGPLTEKLASWMQQQFTERKVEPNSGLGHAISYMQKHWRELTLFLR